MLYDGLKRKEMKWKKGEEICHHKMMTIVLNIPYLCIRRWKKSRMYEISQNKMLNIVLKNMKWTKRFDLNVRVEKLGFRAHFEGRVRRIGLIWKLMSMDKYADPWIF